MLIFGTEFNRQYVFGDTEFVNEMQKLKAFMNVRNKVSEIIMK